MVGLRWWNYIDDQGKSHWIYETREPSEVNPISPTDSKIFWSALFLTPVLWVVFFIVALFSLKFRWLLLVCIAFSLSFANFIGYIRCRYAKKGGGEASSVSSIAKDFFRKQMFKNAMDVMSGGTPAAQTAATSSIV
ncbi:uncharacterized Golgi apparatus membrane protein-like protein CG5021 [Artemia franciscana]